MLKKPITYTDYDGIVRTEDFYFNLNESELTDMQYSEYGGLDARLTKITKSQDLPVLIKIFKDIILSAYGEKSSDGKRFIKVVNGHRLSEDFAQTEAFNVLYMELATSSEKATEFIKGVIPAKMNENNLSAIPHNA